ncbi:hypothetical protein BOTBODRAFT_30257 [Botryobasidium botryosum FD-172 SS1]|uniref:Actin-related protein 2/3 complex subunit 5 n=1 Tax=Botryobasidium botryosum (strain FD-172 SS1) TaxID=930990 RepID=A0A067MZF3_BOTB1|nr:hypothetical protein BOTBODRAFT_30257 [Botryobasidium botryosum FD-172 SS1]
MNNWRRIDIDAYDEDVVHETDLYDPDPRDPATVANDAKQKATQVRSLISRGDIPAALAAVLTDAPYGSQFEDAKNVSLSAVLLILNSTKSTDIPGIVKGLSQDEQDTLMKYLYKGMASQGTEVNGSVLLGWHEKLTEVAGTGCIVRVMTDRRTV